MKNIKLFAAISTALAYFFSCTSSVAQVDPPVTVTAWGMHRGGQVVYKYQVKNMGDKPIERFFIGFYPPTDSADGAAELTVGPYYPGGTSLWLPPSVSQSPAGWGVYLSFPEESATFALAWTEAKCYRGMWPKANEVNMPLVQNPPNVMPPGASWDQFSVTLPKPDYAYVRGHVDFDYGDNDLTVQMVKGDTTPPSLTVSLSPATLWPPNDKLVSVNATIAVQDDYDPEPEIKLESITANESLEAEDLRDASFGTDDRSFKLRAERGRKDDEQDKIVRIAKQLGRIYTVTYSATDASGNKTTASATVTVPHDRDDKELQKSHDSKDGRKDEGDMSSPFSK